jgi:hypothetical protein
MKKQKPKKDKPQEKKKPQPASGEEEEKTFDFGGLPKRDLKKNLGCG